VVHGARLLDGKVVVVRRGGDHEDPGGSNGKHADLIKSKSSVVVQLTIQ
jgi:hypothetical protein